MRQLNLDQLRTLIAIADLGTFAAAAQALHLAPPTVSLHVKELESWLDTPLLQVPCATALRKPAGRTEFLRGVLYPEGGQWRVRTTGAQGSGILSSMADANCFIVLGPQQTAVAAGEPVSVQVLDGLV